MRRLTIIWAHICANAYSLWDLARLAFWADPEQIHPPLQVYTRQSLEGEAWGDARLVTREISLGYWDGLAKTYAPQWVRFRVYFLETYNSETKTWKQQIPTA